MSSFTLLLLFLCSFNCNRNNFIPFQQRALLEQQELRRLQKEQERVRQESERRRKEEEDALDKSIRGKPVEPTTPQTSSTPVHTSISSRVEVAKDASEADSNSPSHSAGQDKAAHERALQRKREQERRRREAVSFSNFLILKFKTIFCYKV